MKKAEVVHTVGTRKQIQRCSSQIFRKITLKVSAKDMIWILV